MFNYHVLKQSLNFFLSGDRLFMSQMSVFKKKSFAIYTISGFITIAGAEYGKVNKSWKW